ncbi:hypothetical protein BN1058_00116 [Paraliobacillus sp. PM-2]|uniref:hypothetical protein n=1 Tax=Paraliobacillus sp. PM-2 TaxID=1462524 RepID=UPI00061BB134|nr:hypothetical protein [Paraliobacillus sp. PM-2]CQR45876.1 hypothetical protein BN1058_00116 [Paraliobacillus sp. PM-2]
MSKTVEQLERELAQSNEDFEQVAGIAERRFLSSLAFRAFLGKKGLTEEFEKYEKQFSENIQDYLNGDIEI